MWYRHSVMEPSGIGLLLLLAAMLATLLTGTFSMAYSSAAVVDPETSLFAFTRCIEDYALNDSLRGERISNWTDWKFDAFANQQTKCFVRCLLEGLKLYDGNVGQFKSEQLVVQYELFKSILRCSRAEVDDLVFQLEEYNNLRDWNAVYAAFIQTVVPVVSTFRQLFLLDHEASSQVYLSLGPLVRKPDESIFHYCEQIFYKEKTDVWCAARNFSIPDDPKFPQHMNCIFRGLRYLNTTDHININEIIRDFHYVGAVDMDENISAHLQDCHIEQEEQKALLYYKCLLNSPFVGQFKDALDYREVRSSNYHYLLVDPMPKYNKSHIQQEINMVNQRHCG